MKTSGLRQQFAFTLVELLTVIVIIAILMGLLFPAISGAIDNSRRAEAGTIIKSIVNASKAYANDYGKYPPIDGALVEVTSGNSTESYYAYGDKDLSNGKVKMNSNEIFDVLRAIAPTSGSGSNKDHVLNRRQQKYYSDGKKAKDVAAGKTRGGFADGKEFGDREGRFYDPWGTEYFVVLDADGNEELDLGKFWEDLKVDSTGNNKVRFSATAFCIGKDRKFGGKGYEGKFKKPGAVNEQPDDIVSWQ
jgi:prepilin-type N-terminal cleavage/methylation domain-containing protein